MNFDDVDFLIEYAEIYDGWSVAVMKDGTCVNRWEDPENPGCAIPGCERLLEATRKALEVTGCDLAEARRLLPEGSQVTGTISVVPQPGAIGVFVDLPHGMAGFVDVLKLPRRARQWPQPGQALRFEVLQHAPGQVRLWPLDPRFHHDGTSPEAETEWRQAKLRYPVGSTVSAQVEHVHAYNREYRIRFTGDDSQHWSGALLPCTGEQPVEGSTGQYRIVAHLDTTRRLMVVPAG